MTEKKKLGSAAPKRKSRNPRPKKKVVAHKEAPQRDRAVPHAPIQKTVAVRRTYIFGVGRRKAAIARVRYYASSSGDMSINGKNLSAYFPLSKLQHIVQAPLQHASDMTGQFTVRVHGGGVHSQAEAIRLGVSRTLITHDHGVRPSLKKAGFLTRDPREKERKKYGLRRARRAPQWQKR